jgi:hypothetical protein
MSVVYLLLFLIPIYAELSSKVNTGGVIKKMWLGIVSLGGLLAFYGKGADVICLGVLIHFLQTLYYSIKYHGRRESERKHHGKAGAL